MPDWLIFVLCFCVGMALSCFGPPVINRLLCWLIDFYDKEGRK